MQSSNLEHGNSEIKWAKRYRKVFGQFEDIYASMNGGGWGKAYDHQCETLLKVIAELKEIDPDSLPKEVSCDLRKLLWLFEEGQIERPMDLRPIDVVLVRERIAAMWAVLSTYVMGTRDIVVYPFPTCGPKTIFMEHLLPR